MKFIFQAVQVLAFGTAIVYGLYGAMTTRPQPTALRIASTDGTEIDLAAFRGRVVMLDFWATWCPGCREEAPRVAEAYRKYHEQGLEVIGVSLDRDQSAMTQFTAENDMPWPENFDGQVWGNAVAQHFGIHSIPTIYLFDKKGRLVTRDAQDDLDGGITTLLREP